MGITKQEGKKQYVIKRSVDVALALLLAVAAILALRILLSDSRKIDNSLGKDDSIISTENSDTPNGQDIYVSEAFDNDEVHKGTLILVNNSTEYKDYDDGLKSILDYRNDSGHDFYSVLDGNVKARSEAVTALDNMLKAFYDETKLETIRVEGAYRSVSEQQAIYDSADDKSAASEPGKSDYHTGYSIDLNVVDEDGNSLDFDGKGDYAWFAENCYKFGFVLRFPEGKEDITGQSARPWHFRYVGKVHAAYMAQNDLCLEEYLARLKTYDYNATHLEAKDSDGKNYEIYYFAADNETAMTSIAVPADYKYDLSGNNTDGFIITISLDEAAEPATEAATDKKSKSE